MPILRLLLTLCLAALGAGEGASDSSLRRPDGALTPPTRRAVLTVLAAADEDVAPWFESAYADLVLLSYGSHPLPCPTRCLLSVHLPHATKWEALSAFAAGPWWAAANASSYDWHVPCHCAAYSAGHPTTLLSAAARPQRLLQYAAHSSHAGCGRRTTTWSFRKATWMSFSVTRSPPRHRCSSSNPASAPTRGRPTQPLCRSTGTAGRR